jgi:nicotinamide-nucleotide amidase
VKKIDKNLLEIAKKDSTIKNLIEYFSEEKKRLTFAESCTGGALVNRFISFPGSSNIIDGSLVTYSNRIKMEWLGVKAETLEKFGAVSSECVEEMAKGARERLKADISIAVSGIAGPSGAVEGKPVGTVFVAVNNGSKITTERLELKGSRNEIQKCSVDWAICLLILSEKKFFDFFSKNS